MKKIVTIFALFLVFGCCSAFAEIIQTPNLLPIETAIKKADSDTLVIFDVDDVLLQPQDQLLKMQNKPYLEGIEKEVETRLPKTQVQELYSLIFIQRQTEPVNKKFIGLIIKTQSKGIKALAITNCFTGPFGKISSMENWRIQELTRLGYHFDKSWGGFKEKVFDKLLSKDPNRFPVFKQGVIFTSSVSKGEVLKAFLKYTGFTPKKILFIDDKKKNLLSVEKFACEKGIKFLGIEYTAVKDSSMDPLNKERARFQFKILEKEHKWLSDEEADVRMNFNKNK